MDYAIGLKYCLTDLKLSAKFAPAPGTFLVEELVDFEKIGFSEERGEYAVIRVVKEGVETYKALGALSRSLGIPPGNILYFGLKDKEASTISHFFVKSSLLRGARFPISLKGVKFEHVGFAQGKPPREAFLGNKFTVRIKGASEEDAETLRRIMRAIEERGLPSYYGYQRFGAKRANTHLLGRYIARGREDLFAYYLLSPSSAIEHGEFLKRARGEYAGLRYERAYVERGLRGLDSRVLSLHVEAFASYLFNLLINYVIESGGYSALDSDLPMPGCPEAPSLYGEVLRAEGVPEGALRKLPCFYRHGLFRPEGVNIIYGDEGITLSFTLRPGLYATIVLREIFKDNLLL